MWCSESAFARRRSGAALLLVLALTLWQGAAHAEGVVLVSARAGDITTLDRELATQLYLGRSTTLPDGRSVRLIDLPAGPERDLFYQQLTSKNPSQIRAYWSRLVFTGRAHPPQEALDIDDAVRRVLADRNALAYLPATAADHPGLRMLFGLGQ
jgi:hypothetical protein